MFDRLSAFVRQDALYRRLADDFASAPPRFFRSRIFSFLLRHEVRPVRIGRSVCPKRFELPTF